LSLQQLLEFFHGQFCFGRTCRVDSLLLDEVAKVVNRVLDLGIGGTALARLHLAEAVPYGINHSFLG
jgi:hypothetical protein